MVTILFLILAWPLAAQDAMETSAPPVPDGRILDDARLFTQQPTTFSKLSQRITEISERTGYEIYVAIFDSLIATDVREQSRVLQEVWIGDRPGVVLVLESDSANYHLAWGRTPDGVTESGEKVPSLAASDLAPQEQVKILNSLAEVRLENTGMTDSAERLIQSFANGIDAAFIRADEAKPERWNVRVLMLGTGLLAAMLLVGLLIGGWIRRSDKKVSERLVFPEVTVGMRLGAPCGGGKVSSRSFDVLSRGRV